MKKRLKTLRRARTTFTTLAPYGRPYRRWLLEGTLASLVLVAARLAFPWPLRGLMEIVFHKGARGRGAAVVALVPQIGDPLWWLVGSFVAIILLWGMSESLQRLAFTRFAIGIVRDARAAALERLPSAAGRDPGDLISAVVGDAARVKTGIKTILIGTSRNGAFFIGVTIIVTLIDPLIGVVFLAGGLATTVVAALGAWRTSRVVRRSRRREGALTHSLHRYFAEGAALPRPTSDPERVPSSKVTRIEGITTFTVHAVLAGSTCAILVLAIQAGRSGRLSAGSVFTILAYILLMHNKTVGFGRRIIRGGRLLPSAERIATLIARQDQNIASRGERNTAHDNVPSVALTRIEYFAAPRRKPL